MSRKKPVLIPNEGETIENKFENEKTKKQFHLNEWWWYLKMKEMKRS